MAKTCKNKEEMDKTQDIMARWTALQPLSDRDREMLSRRFTKRVEKDGTWRLIITPSV